MLTGSRGAESTSYVSVVRAPLSGFVNGLLLGGLLVSLAGLAVVVAGLLSVSAVTVLGIVATAAIAARTAMLELRIGPEGVRATTFWKRRYLRWSEIDRVRVARVEPDRETSPALHVVARPGEGQDIVTSVTQTLRGAALTRMVEAVNVHAASHGVPSSVTEEKVAGWVPEDDNTADRRATARDSRKGPARVTVGVVGWRARLSVDESGVELVDIGRHRCLRWSEMARIEVPKGAEDPNEFTSIEFVSTDAGRKPLKVRVTPAGLQGDRRLELVAAVNRYAARHRVPSSLTEEKIGPLSHAAAEREPKQRPAIQGALGQYVSEIAAAQPDPPRSFDRRTLLRLSLRAALADAVPVLWIGLALAGFAAADPGYGGILGPAAVSFLVLGVAASLVVLLSSTTLKHRRASRALAEGVHRADEDGTRDGRPTLRHPTTGRLLVTLPDTEHPRP